MMQASTKYLSPALKPNVPTLAHLGKAKLFELMTEDDEELAELADGGTVAGLTLDDVDRMSVRELRRALREARETNAAQQRVLADKNEKLILSLPDWKRNPVFSRLSLMRRLRSCGRK